MSEIPKAEDMPRQQLPPSIQDDALITVALALYGVDMAGADEDGRMVAADSVSFPTAVVTRNCEIKGKSYRMTVTVQLKPPVNGST